MAAGLSDQQPSPETYPLQKICNYKHTKAGPTWKGEDSLDLDLGREGEEYSLDLDRGREGEEDSRGPRLGQGERGMHGKLEKKKLTIPSRTKKNIFNTPLFFLRHFFLVSESMQSLSGHTVCENA